MEAALSNLLYDNPELYEEIYHGSNFEVPRLCERFFDGTPQMLLDVGCGTGRDLEYFARLGINCVGIDLRPPAIAYARTRRPGIDFQIADMRQTRLGRTFDVITCLDLRMRVSPTDHARRNDQTDR